MVSSVIYTILTDDDVCIGFQTSVLFHCYMLVIKIKVIMDIVLRNSRLYKYKVISVIHCYSNEEDIL